MDEDNIFLAPEIDMPLHMGRGMAPPVHQRPANSRSSSRQASASGLSPKLSSKQSSSLSKSPEDKKKADSKSGKIPMNYVILIIALIIICIILFVAVIYFMLNKYREDEKNKKLQALSVARGACETYPLNRPAQVNPAKKGLNPAPVVSARSHEGSEKLPTKDELSKELESIAEETEEEEAETPDEPPHIISKIDSTEVDNNTKTTPEGSGTEIFSSNDEYMDLPDMGQDDEFDRILSQRVSREMMVEETEDDADEE